MSGPECQEGWGPPSGDPKLPLLQGLLMGFGWIERSRLDPLERLPDGRLKWAAIASPLGVRLPPLIFKETSA